MSNNISNDRTVGMFPPPRGNVRVALAHQTAVVQKRHADTFIWWPTELLACFKNEVLGPVTSTDVQRWILKLMDRPKAKLNVKPVNIEPYNEQNRPIECRQAKSPSSVSSMAEFDVLTSGHYCVDYQEHSGHEAREYPTRCQWILRVPYSSIGVYVRYESENGEIPPVPQDLLIQGKERSQSQGKCVLTGSTGLETVTWWIFPPLAACGVPNYHNCPGDIDPDEEESLTHVANLISMRKDLYELFIENAFGVDVDNDFKIRIFDPSASNIGLPDRLEILDVDKHTKYFLEGHFLWCLNARFHGGSIEDDPRFTRYEAEHFLARLSYAYDEDASEAYQLKAEDWETQLGQAVLEFLTFKDPDFKIPEARVDRCG